MSIFAFFVRRPVIAWVLNLFILAAGLLTFTKLQMQDEPTQAQKIIVVEAHYSGYMPTRMDKAITKHLEDAVAGAPGLSYYTSSSSENSAKVYAYFKTGELENAATYIREGLSAGAEHFPQNMRTPVIIRGDNQSQGMRTHLISVSGDRDKFLSLHEYMSDKRRIGVGLQAEIRSIDGVADCRVPNTEGKMTLYLDPEAMYRNQVSIRTSFEAVYSHLSNYSAGYIIRGFKHKKINFKVEMPSSDTGILAIIVPTIDGKGRVPLGAFAQVHHVTRHEQELTRVNGKDGIILSITAKADGNPITISREVRKIVAKFQEVEESEIKILTDKGEEIEDEIHSLWRAIIDTIVIVLVVVGFLLGSARASLITLMTIPISLFGASSFVYFMGFTINYYTLLAAIFAVGLVVDDAIIVVENISFYIEQKLSPADAATRSVEEIYKSIIGMTLTLAAVFMPVVLIGEDPCMTQFTATLAIMVIISGFVALVLSPMMCARLLLPHKESVKGHKTSFYRNSTVHYVNALVDKIGYACDIGYKAIERWYQALLQQFLAHKYYISFMLWPVITMLGFVVYTTLPHGFAAEEGESVAVRFLSPRGATIDYNDTYARQIEEVAREIKGARDIWSHIKTGSVCEIACSVGSPRKRDKSISSIADLEKRFTEECVKKTSGVQIIVESKKSDSDADGYEFTTYGRIPTDKMNELAKDVIQTMRETGLFASEPRVTTQFDKIEHYSIEPKNEDLKGASLRDIIDTIKYCGGTVWSYIDEQEGNGGIGSCSEMTANILPLAYDPNKIFTSFAHVSREDLVRPCIPPLPRSDINVFLSSIHVQAVDHKTNHVSLIPLSEIMTASIQTEPMAIYKRGGLPSITFGARIRPGIGLAKVHAYVLRALKKVLPPGVMIQGGQNIQKLEESGNSTALIYFGAFIFVFLFLAFLYESFLDPFITLPTICVACTGGCIGLLLCNSSITNHTPIAILTVTGLILKHGILIVEFANRAMQEGLTPDEAVTRAMKERFRPIMMTTVAMILGMFSLLHDNGVQAVMRHELAIFVIFGMICGTILTILVVPCVYVVCKSIGFTPAKDKE